MNGGMAEARAECAHLEKVNVKTFTRFVEFVYSGKYTEPEPTADQTVEPAKHRHRSIAFCDYSDDCELDRSQVFMCHAEMYAFAEMYMVEDLMVLATECMMRYSNLNVCESRLKDILEVVRFTYSSTLESGEAGFRKGLTILVYKRRRYWADENELLDLVMEIPEFARDLVRQSSHT